MKTLLISALIAAAMLAGCSKQGAQAQGSRDKADAQARADALRKEMDTAPKVFTNRDTFKRNEPAKADPKQPPAAETKP